METIKICNALNYKERQKAKRGKPLKEWWRPRLRLCKGTRIQLSCASYEVLNELLRGGSKQAGHRLNLGLKELRRGTSLIKP